MAGMNSCETPFLAVSQELFRDNVPAHCNPGILSGTLTINDSRAHIHNLRLKSLYVIFTWITTGKPHKFLLRQLMVVASAQESTAFSILFPFPFLQPLQRLAGCQVELQRVIET